MPKTLLLADDSVTIQKVVGISFASEDIAITTVDNGDDAIAKARELRPDVILADVVMPGKSGYEVCEAVKTDPELRHTPVLLLTGTFEAFDEERAARAGAAGHVSKPFEAQTLVERVKELLAAPAPAPPGPPPHAAAVPEGPTHPDLRPGQAFDFFDDEPSDLAEPPATAREPMGEMGDDSLDLDDPDAAFAFGEDDLAPVAQEPSAAPPLHGREATPDSTVAILPDEVPRPQPGAAEAFAFGTGGAGSAEAPVGSDDLAEATLLDPAAGSGFDVSSSDLGPAPEPVASGTQTVEVPPPPPAARPPAPPPRQPAGLPRDAVLDLLDPGREAEATTGDPARAPSPPSPPAQPPAWSQVEEPLARPFGAEDAPERGAPGGAEADPPRFETAGLAPEAEPLELEPEPEPTSFSAEPRDTRSTPLSPALREELHETLEKVAWDAFGPLTDKIVQQAVERIEQVAWEIVPKLAESLIQEEIRRLKGE